MQRIITSRSYPSQKTLEVLSHICAITILSDFSRQPLAAQILFVAYVVCESLHMEGFLLWSLKGKYVFSHSVLKDDLHIQILGHDITVTA
jgi:hypothetical protein